MAYSLKPKVFDYQKLSDLFNEICPDFYDTQWVNSISMAFASMVLLNFGPESRILKQKHKEKIWRLKFPAKNKPKGIYVFILTNHFSCITNVQPHLNLNRILIPLYQASLLAAAKLCRVIPEDIKDRFPLIPLARAIFNPQSIPKISVDLSRLLGRPVHISEVLKVIISSCLLGGFYLEHSACHVAILAVAVIPSRDNIRKRIRARTIRAYEEHHKVFDPSQFEIYLRHSKLSGVEPADIVETFETMEISSDKRGREEHVKNNENLYDGVDRNFWFSHDPSVSVTSIAPQSLPKTAGGSECLQVAEEDSLNIDITTTDYKDLKTHVIKTPATSNVARAERSIQKDQGNERTDDDRWSMDESEALSRYSEKNGRTDMPRE